MDERLDLLLNRHSVASRQLQEPGPDAATLERLLTAAIHVPDHGKLVPWRLIVLRGAAKQEMGERLAALFMRKHPEAPEAKRDKEARRYTYAPLVIAVVSRIDPESRILPQEQMLSAGCVAYGLLLASAALGFGAEWLTGWAANDPDAAQVFGLGANEHIISFVHIGTPRHAIPDRLRPAVADVVSTWMP